MIQERKDNIKQALVKEGVTQAVTMGANAILPGLGSVLGPVSGAITGNIQAKNTAVKGFNEQMSAVGQTNNPYMADGGFIKSAAQVWSKYGGDDGRKNLVEQMKKGGYLKDDKVTPNAVKAMQKDLTAKGYNIGKIDGVAGRKTLSAMMDLETDNTEFITDNELEFLGEGEGIEKTDRMFDRTTKSRRLSDNVIMRSTKPESTIGLNVMQSGGKIVGVPDLAKYVGPSHANGGIMVDDKGMPTAESNAAAEVEGDEMILNMNGESYVFSKRLKI
jgi:hypothetical protein